MDLDLGFAVPSDGGFPERGLEEGLLEGLDRGFEEGLLEGRSRPPNSPISSTAAPPLVLSSSPESPSESKMGFLFPGGGRKPIGFAFFVMFRPYERPLPLIVKMN